MQRETQELPLLGFRHEKEMEDVTIQNRGFGGGKCQG